MSKHAWLLAGALLAWVAAGTGYSATRAPKNHGLPATPQPAAVQTPVPVAAAPSPTPVPIDRSAQVVVFGYHRLVDRVRRPDTEITPTEFEAQMRQLRDQGIQVIPLQSLLAWKRGEKSIPPKCAVITLDDGWKSQYEIAWPILRKYGYPFTLFIYTDYVRGGPKSGGESLGWEQLAEMRDAGVDIQGHTASHHDLTKMPRTAAFPDYGAWLWNELNGSKQQLEQHLGIKVNALAVPYGRYNSQVREAAHRAGYEAILTVFGRKIGFETPADGLGRYMIETNKPKVFASAIRFDTRGGETLPAVAEYATGTVAVQPADGATVADARPVIQLRVDTFGNPDPKSLSMRVSGLGKVDARYDPKAKTFAFQPPRKLGTTTYSVIVTGESEGKRQQIRWTFTVAPETAKVVVNPAAVPKPGAVSAANAAGVPAATPVSKHGPK